MPGLLGIVFSVFFILRLATIVISSRNEKKLLEIGAREFGKSNSLLLLVMHILFYASCLTEGFQKGAFFTDGIAYFGLALFVFSILVLYYVIYSIRHVWTVKLIIAPREYHTINSSFLFKYLRHPNYFLNIIPELTGLGLLFHAWLTLGIGLPLYFVPLIIRIIQEEKLMKQHFSDY